MPVAPVKKPDGWPPSSLPGTTFSLRSFVRRTRHGSLGLWRKSFVALPYGAMLTAAAGAGRSGLRAT